MSQYDPSRHRARMTTVSENYECIKAIYNTVQESFGDKKMIFTVSPIPLNATFQDMSCMVADAGSKSVLRAAIQEFWNQAPPNFIYWPSFEIVKWVSAHLEFTMYSGTDSRHVHSAAISLITDAFLERFFVP